MSPSMTFPLFAVMTAVSLIFYPLVNIFSKMLGKKKLIAFAFLFFSFTFFITSAAGYISIPPMIYGVAIAVLAAVPMAILGILPQAVVADISEADKVDTGESRQGMFYAARTFAFKLGQSLAMLMFTSMATIKANVPKGEKYYGLGYRCTALLAAVLCLLGGLVFLQYNEKKVISQIEEEQKNA